MKESVSLSAERAKGTPLFTQENLAHYAPVFRKVAYHLGAYLFPANDKDKAYESYKILEEGSIPNEIYNSVWKAFKAIVEGSWQGDPAEAPHYVKHHFEHLYFLTFYRAIWRYGREPDSADVRDIAISYVERRGFQRLVRNFDPAKGGRKYILRAAENYLRDWYRSHKHRIAYHHCYLSPQSVLYEEKFEDYEPFSEEPQGLNIYSESWELIDEVMLIAVAKEILMDTLRRMNKFEYACVLRDYMDYSLDRLVELMGCEKSTLKSAMSRHRKQVKERLESAGYELRYRVGEEEWMTLDRAKLMETALVEAVQALSESPCNPHSRR